MRRSIPVLGQEFPSKEALKQHIKNRILDKYGSHQLLDEADFRFMYAVLRMHRWADEKIGCGVKSMWVQENPPYRTWGFWLERRDGTKTDFSYLECVNKPPRIKDFLTACRVAVAEQVKAFKVACLKAGTCRCPISGSILTLVNSEVDHVAPKTFDWLVHEFIRSERLDPDIVEILGYADGEVERYFKDATLCKKWQSFHFDNADLRLIAQPKYRSMPRS